jgi:hypothetical protein
VLNLLDARLDDHGAERDYGAASSLVVAQPPTQPTNATTIANPTTFNFQIVRRRIRSRSRRVSQQQS